MFVDGKFIPYFATVTLSVLVGSNFLESLADARDSFFSEQEWTIDAYTDPAVNDARIKK